MFQRDYILRMIEMMGDLMRRVKELMDELAQMRLLEEACRRQCGLPLSALETLSAASLTEMLSPTPRLFASELIYLRAMASPDLWEEGRMLRLKSLRLLLTLAEEGPLCELRAPRVQALKVELMDLLLPEDLMACAAFLRQGGAYADMEDALFEAAERYVLLGVLVFTAPVAFATGAAQTTSNIFKAWCRMLGGQVFLLLMNAWCLRLFTSMVGTFIANPLSL